MLSIIHITSRGLHPFIEEPDRHLGQYDVLSNALQAQSCQNFELVCVDACNPLPRPELAWWLRDRVRFVRPRSTPWTRLGAFAANVARNAGLQLARGATVCLLDDCYSPSPYFVARVLELAARGLYPVPFIRPRAGAGGAYPVQGPTPLGQDRDGCGLLCFPRAAAVECNGYDEIFERPRDDSDFVDRLQRAGVHFVRDPGVYVVAHPHGYDPRHRLRCSTLAMHLTAARESVVGNQPWSEPELATWNYCPHRGPVDGDGITPCALRPGLNSCEIPFAAPAAATPTALAIINDHETRPWFDLAAERERALRAEE
jgi:hypothetical protein